MLILSLAASEVAPKELALLKIGLGRPKETEQ
jgi:hypothetical protein